VIDCGFLQAGSFSNGYSRVIPFAVTMSGKLSQIEEVIDRNGHVVDADGRNIIKVPVGVSSQ